MRPWAEQFLSFYSMNDDMWFYCTFSFDKHNILFLDEFDKEYCKLCVSYRIIINFDEVDFSKCRSKEMISFFWHSIYYTILAILIDLSIYGLGKSGWGYSLKNRVNNSLHSWREDISLVEEWISLDSNSSRVKIHFSTSGISSGSLDILSKRNDHWRHSPGSDVSDK